MSAPAEKKPGSLAALAEVQDMATIQTMFEDATLVLVIGKGGGSTYPSWRSALPHVRVGDRLRIRMLDGTIRCADVLPPDRHAAGGLEWALVARPC